MDIDLEKMHLNELKELKDRIQKRLVIENSKIKDSEFINNKFKLSELIDGENIIYCVIFDGVNIKYVDYVNISFYISDDEYIDFTTNHKTKPMGCSCSLNKGYLDNYCYLGIIDDDMIFFTLRPATIIKDLHIEIENTILEKKDKLVDEIEQLRDSIGSFSYAYDNIKN